MEYRLKDIRYIEQDRQKTIMLEGETFIIKALFPKDQREIARRVAIEQNGLPVSAFSVDDRYRFIRDITVDYAIVKAPDWWRSVQDCIDDALIDTLYKEIQDWTTEFQELLKKNRPS